MAHEPFRLTQVVTAAGCAAKLGPRDLEAALKHLTPIVDPRLLVGPETLDDAAVIALSPDLALCFTADFITPLVDDPHDWGAIAATNAISDVYAMGGRPLAALNLLAWPAGLPEEVLGQVLSGGAAAARDAGCMIVGGHSVVDKEPKYGLAVIGTVRPDAVVRNQGAQAGDVLFLTKSLGTGVISTAIKAELANPESIAAATRSMKTLNAAAAEAALAAGVRAMTDVTGFSLLGHLTEMLGPTGTLGARLSAAALPLLPHAAELVSLGMAPAGAYRNRTAYCGRVSLAPGLPDGLDMLLYDPQTSGGLLLAIAPEMVERFTAEAACRGVPAHRLGQFDSSGRIAVS
jgi:selenide,water dikinase